MKKYHKYCQQRRSLGHMRLEQNFNFAPPET